MAHEGDSTADDGGLVFRLPDPDREYARVRLDADLGVREAPRDLTWADGVWELRIPTPPLARLQYRFEVTRAVLDAAAEHRAPGPFGTVSERRLPGYAPPAWLTARTVPGTTEELPFRADSSATAELQATTWVPAGLGADEPAPLLVAHDGPEYRRAGALVRYVGVLIARGAVPPTRILLLGSADRERWYSASDTYADCLVDQVLPAATERWATGAVVVAGVSLGALAALHAAWRHPGAFDGLFLQSGSFFTPATDAQESRFARFPQVTSFVAEVLAAPIAEPGTVVGLTCGATEENTPNNRLMAAALRRMGWDVGYAETPDLHNFTSWRDALDPHLERVLTTAVGRSRAA